MNRIVPHLFAIPFLSFFSLKEDIPFIYLLVGMCILVEAGDWKEKIVLKDGCSNSVYRRHGSHS